MDNSSTIIGPLKDLVGATPYSDSEKTTVADEIKELREKNKRTVFTAIKEYYDKLKEKHKSKEIVPMIYRFCGAVVTALTIGQLSHIMILTVINQWFGMHFIISYVISRVSSFYVGSWAFMEVTFTSKDRAFQMQMKLWHIVLLVAATTGIGMYWGGRNRRQAASSFIASGSVFLGAFMLWLYGNDIKSLMEDMSRMNYIRTFSDTASQVTNAIQYVINGQPKPRNKRQSDNDEKIPLDQITPKKLDETHKSLLDDVEAKISEDNGPPMSDFAQFCADDRNKHILYWTEQLRFAALDHTKIPTRLTACMMIVEHDDDGRGIESKRAPRVASPIGYRVPIDAFIGYLASHYRRIGVDSVNFAVNYTVRNPMPIEIFETFAITYAPRLTHKLTTRRQIGEIEVKLIDNYEIDTQDYVLPIWTMYMNNMDPKFDFKLADAPDDLVSKLKNKYLVSKYNKHILIDEHEKSFVVVSVINEAAYKGSGMTGTYSLVSYNHDDPLERDDVDFDMKQITTTFINKLRDSAEYILSKGFIPVNCIMQFESRPAPDSRGMMRIEDYSWMGPYLTLTWTKTLFHSGEKKERRTVPKNVVHDNAPPHYKFLYDVFNPSDIHTCDLHYDVVCKRDINNWSSLLNNCNNCYWPDKKVKRNKVVTLVKNTSDTISGLIPTFGVETKLRMKKLTPIIIVQALIVGAVVLFFYKRRQCKHTANCKGEDCRKCVDCIHGSVCDQYETDDKPKIPKHAQCVAQCTHHKNCKKHIDNSIPKHEVWHTFITGELGHGWLEKWRHKLQDCVDDQCKPACIHNDTCENYVASYLNVINPGMVESADVYNPSPEQMILEAHFKRYAKREDGDYANEHEPTHNDNKQIDYYADLEQEIIDRLKTGRDEWGDIDSKEHKNKHTATVKRSAIAQDPSGPWPGVSAEQKDKDYLKQVQRVLNIMDDPDDPSALGQAKRRLADLIEDRPLLSIGYIITQEHIEGTIIAEQLYKKHHWQDLKQLKALMEQINILRALPDKPSPTQPQTLRIDGTDANRKSKRVDWLYHPVPHWWPQLKSNLLKKYGDDPTVVSVLNKPYAWYCWQRKLITLRDRKKAPKADAKLEESKAQTIVTAIDRGMPLKLYRCIVDIWVQGSGYAFGSGGYVRLKDGACGILTAKHNIHNAKSEIDDPVTITIKRSDRPDLESECVVDDKHKFFGDVSFLTIKNPNIFAGVAPIPIGTEMTQCRIFVHDNKFRGLMSKGLRAAFDEENGYRHTISEFVPVKRHTIVTLDGVERQHIIAYRINTQAGDSGSLVLNENNEVIAVHAIGAVVGQFDHNGGVCLISSIDDDRKLLRSPTDYTFAISGNYQQSATIRSTRHGQGMVSTRDPTYTDTTQCKLINDHLHELVDTMEKLHKRYEPRLNGHILHMKPQPYKQPGFNQYKVMHEAKTGLELKSTYRLNDINEDTVSVACAKFTAIPKQMSDKHRIAYEMALEITKQMLSNHFTYTDLSKPLSYDEAIDQLDPTTAPGYPYNKLYHTKGQAFKCPEFRKESEIRWNMRLTTKLHEVTLINPKRGEVMPSNKCDKMRVVMCDPVSRIVDAERLFGRFKVGMIRTSHLLFQRKSFSTLGQGIHYGTFELLHKMLKDKVCVGTDATSWEASLHKNQMKDAFNMIADIINFSDPSDRIRYDQVADELVSGFMACPNGQLIYKDGKNGSGNGMTAQLNTVMMFIYTLTCVLLQIGKIKIQVEFIIIVNCDDVIIGWMAKIKFDPDKHCFIMGNVFGIILEISETGTIYEMVWYNAKFTVRYYYGSIRCMPSINTDKLAASLAVAPCNPTAAKQQAIAFDLMCELTDDLKFKQYIRSYCQFMSVDIISPIQKCYIFTGEEPIAGGIAYEPSYTRSSMIDKVSADHLVTTIPGEGDSTGIINTLHSCNVVKPKLHTSIINAGSIGPQKRTTLQTLSGTPSLTELQNSLTYSKQNHSKKCQSTNSLTNALCRLRNLEQLRKEKLKQASHQVASLRKQRKQSLLKQGQLERMRQYTDSKNKSDIRECKWLFIQSSNTLPTPLPQERSSLNLRRLQHLRNEGMVHQYGIRPDEWDIAISVQDMGVKVNHPRSLTFNRWDHSLLHSQRLIFGHCVKFQFVPNILLASKLVERLVCMITMNLSTSPSHMSKQWAMISMVICTEGTRKIQLNILLVIQPECELCLQKKDHILAHIMAHQLMTTDQLGDYPNLRDQEGFYMLAKMGIQPQQLTHDKQYKLNLYCFKIHQYQTWGLGLGTYGFQVLSDFTRQHCSQYLLVDVPRIIMLKVKLGPVLTYLLEQTRSQITLKPKQRTVTRKLITKTIQQCLTSAGIYPRECGSSMRVLMSNLHQELQMQDISPGQSLLVRIQNGPTFRTLERATLVIMIGHQLGHSNTTWFLLVQFSFKIGESTFRVTETTTM